MGCPSVEGATLVLLLYHHPWGLIVNCNKMPQHRDADNILAAPAQLFGEAEVAFIID
jgi:hypothetical protein